MIISESVFRRFDYYSNNTYINNVKEFNVENRTLIYVKNKLVVNSNSTSLNK